MKCHKCKKEMTRTPVCADCGIIPIAEGEFNRRDDRIKQLEKELNMILIEIRAGSIDEHTEKRILQTLG